MIQADEPAKQLQCKHYYHSSCLIAWCTKKIQKARLRSDSRFSWASTLEVFVLFFCTIFFGFFGMGMGKAGPVQFSQVETKTPCITFPQDKSSQPVIYL